MKTVDSLTERVKATRLQLWANHRTTYDHDTKLPIETKEELPPGHYTDWSMWKSLNRLRTGVGRCNYNMFKLVYHERTACKCGEVVQTMDQPLYWLINVEIPEPSSNWRWQMQLQHVHVGLPWKDSMQMWRGGPNHGSRMRTNPWTVFELALADATTTCSSWSTMKGQHANVERWSKPWIILSRCRLMTEECNIMGPISSEWPSSWVRTMLAADVWCLMTDLIRRSIMRYETNLSEIVV